MEKNNREYSNGEIKVFWIPSLCVHSTICFSELPDVFVPSSRPWVRMNAASTKQIIQTVNHCPTGALKWEKIEEQIIPEEPIKSESAKITIIKNGPICISGDMEIIHEDGSKITKKGKIALCRCNRSKNMPYCDGSHLVRHEA
jgi:uncharacterized Fe-S cluster protein YjdI